MQNYKKIIIAIACMLALVGCWFYYSGRTDVSDIGKSADNVRTELTDAAESQRREAETLDRATEAVDNGRSAVSDSKQTAGRIEDIERSDAEIITASQSILSEVRKRGPAQNPSQD